MLHVRNLQAAYRGIQALRGVTISVRAGEMVALIGANGAGKSTLLNCISGVVKPVSGSVEFDATLVTHLPPWSISRRGLLQVPEGRQVFADLTVLENLQAGSAAVAGRRAEYSLQDVYELFPVLAERKAQLAGSLSGGQQQMLAIGRALMGSPRMLLLDEPSLGLAPLVIGQVFAALQKINRRGLTVLLVEQNARRALEVSTRAYVLDQGRVAQEGQSKLLAADSNMAAHYLGEPA